MAQSENELRDLQEDFLAAMAMDMNLSKDELLEVWDMSRADLGYKFRLRSTIRHYQSSR
jgi:hypothetical protein